MKLRIKNLGPIKHNEQTIDLSRNFYVFMGYNNSGKTYVSQLLWTIFNESKLRDFAKAIYLDFINLEDNKLELNRNLLEQFLNNFSRFLEAEFIKVLGIKPDQIGKISLSLEIDDDEFNQLKEESFSCIAGVCIGEIKGAIEFIFAQKDKNSLILFFDFIDSQEPIKRLKEGIKIESFQSTFTTSLLKEIMDSQVIIAIINLLLKPRHTTFFLPSSRSFYPAFYKYIYKIDREEREKDQSLFLDILVNIDQNLPQGSERTEQLKTLQDKLYNRSHTEPMDRAFEALYSLNMNANKPVNYYPSILEKLVSIMGGDITVNSVEGIGIVEFGFRFDEQKNVPMYLASSAANQLTLLYLYFKYWVKPKNNFLLIDEPEENLHPENQIKLMELLLEFANQNNNKVLITTHSPLMTDTVNNYLYIDKLKEYGVDVEEIFEKHDLQYLNPNLSISRDKLGIYFFTGDKIIEYNTGHYGVYVRNFVKVVESLKKSANILTDYIYEKENE